MQSVTMSDRAAGARYLAQVNRAFGVPPLFDPETGTTVLEPSGTGPGWWVGAPSVVWTDDRYFLSYRVRLPQPTRGGETRISCGTNGEHFQTIWKATKEQFNTPSIERCALVRADEWTWRLYVSYVDGATGKWRIDMLEATAPDAFDPAKRVPILTPEQIDAEGVKDPWICQVGGVWIMLASIAVTRSDVGVDQTAFHATKDIYNTGYARSCTGRATSIDGVHWHWEGTIFEPRDRHWDAYAARLNSVVWRPPVWIGFYDGSASVAENYEERCGIAYSMDLCTWQRASADGPAIGPNGGPGSIRYVESVQGPDWVRYYYEFTRADGSHELRTNLVPLE